MSLATGTGELVHISSVVARFLAVGEIIERHQGHLYEVVQVPVDHETDPTRVVVMCMNEDGGIEPLTMHRNLMVRTYDEI